MISAVVLTKNEERNIGECLETLKWCEEVVVVDDYSTDKTIEIAKKLGAKVFVRDLNNDFSGQRNYGLEKARGKWVLFIDTDERVSPQLREEILKTVRTQNLPRQKLCGFYLRRRDFMWGRELRHGETGKIKLLRLGKKEAGEWVGRVHERWQLKGEVRELKNPLFHYPHQTIAEFLKEINFYSGLRAQELYAQGIHVYWASIICYPLGKFLKNYFLKLGFFDGIPGFLVAMMMICHSFFVRGKLWLLWQK